ncbi:MAG: hypothetical protein IMF01_08575 [Proteobacteria bacterium]|nr:hypothetical protein [Pseudomonadota bacterium]
MKRIGIVLAVSIALLIIASGICVSVASNQTIQQTSVPPEQWNRTFGVQMMIWVNQCSRHLMVDT